jgi:hypothetical protein
MEVIKPLDKLTCEELYSRLKSDAVSLSSLADKCLQHQISGEVLMTLTEDEMKEMGLTIGHRRQLKTIISEAKQKAEDDTNLEATMKKMMDLQVEQHKQVMDMMQKQTDIFAALVRDLTGAKPKKQGPYITVHPASKDVKLQISGLKYSATQTADQPIDCGAMSEGRYTITASYITGTNIPLGVWEFEYDGVDKVSPQYIDMQVQHLNLKFTDQNVPVSNSNVKGTFTSNQTNYNINTTTNNAGTVGLVLPTGRLNVSTTHNNTTISHSFDVQKPAPVSQSQAKDAKPMPVSYHHNPKYVTIDNNDCTVVLGDVSGSMGRGNQMQLLKNTFLEILRSQLRSGYKVALASWDTQTYWCNSGRWMKSHSEQTIAEQWINSQVHRGDNDMRQAIISAINSLSDAKHIIIMCDGDVTPFDNRSWEQLVNKYNNIVFHLVAIGQAADKVMMQKMATIGRGSFSFAV